MAQALHRERIMSIANARPPGRKSAVGPLLLLAVLPWVWACSGDEGTGQPAAGAGGGGSGGAGGVAAHFDSASPGAPVPVSEAGSSGMGSAGTGGGGGGLPIYASFNAAAAIENADIVRFEGTRLYALSRHAGLTVIDYSNPEDLQVLGRDRPLEDTPSDMYVRGGIVLELYWHRGTFVFNSPLDDLDTLPGDSKLRVLDARSDELKLIRELSISGLVAGSRLVGDTLFVASADGYPTLAPPQTYVTSFDVSSPEDPQKRDQLSFPNVARGIKISDERMYFASYDRDKLESSIVRVDLSSGSAKSVLGATVRFPGAVYADWQMDEYQGVLRVVSQPYAFNLRNPACVRTFSVEPSGELGALAAVDLVTQAAELTTVRFDAARAYALNAAHNVIALDLQDPAAPKQLESQSWPAATVDLEARDQRVFALALAPKGSDGWLSVSAFDATAPAGSEALSVVRFGSDWTVQDFEQKKLRASLNMFDTDGFVLVPTAGSKPNDAAPTCTTQRSGIQVISWKNDALTLHGLAELKGQAQLAVIRDHHLFAFSDRQASVFDLGMNAEPKRMDAVALEQRVDKTFTAGPNNVVRLARDARTRATELDVTTASDVEMPGDGQLSLPPPEDSCPDDSLHLASFADQDRVFLVMRDTFGAAKKTQYRVVTLDVSEPAAPRVLANATLPFTPEVAFAKPAALVDSGAVVVAHGATLAFAERSVAAKDVSKLDYVLRVVDLTQPASPKVVSIELATALGATSLLIDDQTVVTSHYEPSPEDDKRVRFFLDRVDISNPRAPRRLPSINIPGSLLALQPTAASAITVDYQPGEQDYGTDLNCENAYMFYRFDPETGACNGIVQRLQLVQLDANEATRLGSLTLNTYESVAATAATADRLFARLASRPHYSGASVCEGGCGDRLPNLLVLGGLSEDVWQTGRLELSDGDISGLQPIAADGQRAALWSGFQGSLSVVDGSDAASPSLLSSMQTGIVIPLDMQCIAGQGVAALGADGVRMFPLAP